MTKVVLANLSDREPCCRKTRPPSPTARAEADRIRRKRSGAAEGDQVVIDFADYAQQARPFDGTDEQAGNR